MIAPCRMCGKSDGRVVAEHDCIYNGMMTTVSYVSCPCGVTYPDPFPSEQEVRTVYEKGYMDRKEPGTNLHLRFKEGHVEQHRVATDMTLSELGVDLEEWKHQKKMILDVGCANGIFLNYLREKGIPSSFGIDVSGEMVDEARRRGLMAARAMILNAPVALIPDGQVEWKLREDDKGLHAQLEQTPSWDVITMWDVLEHMADPKAALKHAFKILLPGGELIIQTPCIGIISHAMGRYWRNYIYPQHLHLFSKRGLFGWLGKVGFETSWWLAMEELPGVAREHEWFTRFGSGNTSGTVPDHVKRAADAVAKKSGMGDTIAVRVRKP